MLDSAKNNAHSSGKRKRKSSILYLALVAILLVVSIAVVAVVQSHKNANRISSNSYVHPVVKSTCAATLYPDLCISAIANAPAATISSIKSPKDVILASLNHTITNAQQNYQNVRSITFARTSQTKRERVALQDCLQTINDTLVELHKTSIEIKEYVSQSKNYSLAQRVENVKTLLSAAMTNQETCLDGFSENKAEKEFRNRTLDGELIGCFRLCSNVLAMFKNLTEAQLDGNNPGRQVEHLVPERRLAGMDDSEHEWPYWLSAGDRRLLQAGTVTPDVTVAADGSGDYRTVSAAVEAAPGGSSRRYIIKIKAGAYRENVEVTKKNLMFIGDGQKTTIITANRSVKGGSTTFRSATVAVSGEAFLARDITFQNTAGPSGEQAVALRVSADYAAFYKCSMIAYQDTLYVHTLRQFYRRCIIIGTVDFIFGNAAASFQDCNIHARKPGPKQKNMVTAQGRDDPNQNTGIVIQRCRIGATKDLLAEKDNYPTYLGRPWKNYSRTVIMLTEITDIIDPAGWYEWDGDFALDTLYYAEYKNTGAGSGTANRVTWKGYKVITSEAEARSFTPEEFISGSTWLGSTGFPYTLGL